MTKGSVNECSGVLAVWRSGVLRLMQIDTPQAGAGQVRVQVKATGVQPFDCAVRAGWTPPGVAPGFPKIPGNEFAGGFSSGAQTAHIALLELHVGNGDTVLVHGAVGTVAVRLAVEWGKDQ